MPEYQGFEIEALFEKEKYTSPTQLAYARAYLSHELLFGHTHVAPQAVLQHIFSPSELDCLDTFEAALPYPYPYGFDASFNFIYRHTGFLGLIDRLYRHKQRMGIYFMTADMLNAGHISACVKAKEYCDVLILMLETDLIAAGMKSTPDDIRPKLSQLQRVYMACQVPAVDYVYVVPLVASPAAVLFELVARARILENLKRIKTKLSVQTVEDFYKRGKAWMRNRQYNGLGFDPTVAWQDYVIRYLGGGGSRFRPGTLQSEFFSQGMKLGIHPSLQLSYYYLWDQWVQEKDNFDLVTVFKPASGSQWASLFEFQARYFNWEDRLPQIVTIESSAPQTSSTQLFSQHPLESEALRENLEILAILKSWGKKVGEDFRFFTDWENPLLGVPYAEYAL